MTSITDKQVYKNRKKVIEFLKQPGLKKATGRLENPSTGGRCCLGHMCVALGVKRKQVGNVVYYGRNDLDAPTKVQEALGLHGSTGYADNLSFLELDGLFRRNYSSLAALNDESRAATPQRIAQYLESVILGGGVTPWKKINIE